MRHCSFIPFYIRDDELCDAIDRLFSGNGNSLSLFSRQQNFTEPKKKQGRRLWGSDNSYIALSRWKIYTFSMWHPIHRTLCTIDKNFTEYIKQWKNVIMLFNYQRWHNLLVACVSFENFSNHLFHPFTLILLHYSRDCVAKVKIAPHLFLISIQGSLKLEYLYEATV